MVLARERIDRQIKGTEFKAPSPKDLQINKHLTYDKDDILKQ